MSLPGCADQTIHADTSHIYVHTHLPPHYLNLFTPALPRGDEVAVKEYVVTDKKKQYKNSNNNISNHNNTIKYESFAIGQTAFVVGSHTLDIAGRIMTTEGGQSLLEERLIRPQLDMGDALIFDCRILHFGLANQAEMIPTADVLNENNSEMENNNLTSGWRPMLYVNYHCDWFHDPKNWNDAEKLFAQNR